MTEEQEKMLFDFLESLGFTNSELKERTLTKIELGIARFSETETIFFGEERMHYQLNFARDPQFQGYRLTGYDAIYRQPIAIEHGTVNGINTAELEQQMQGINWSTISVSTLSRLENEKAWNREAETIQDIVSRVWRLSDNDNAQGKQIQDRLRLKYWLDTPFDSPSELQMLRGAYEVRRTFPVTEYGSCPANLAYHILSGRLDDAYEKLRHANVEGYFNIDLHKRLCEELSRNPDSFQIGTALGDVELALPITKIDGWYSLDTYSITLTTLAPIVHGTHNGINSEELEAKMREIDWFKDRELYILRDDVEPEFLPHIELILQQLFQLRQDPAGAQIANSLELKYWLDAPLFDAFIDGAAWDYWESLPKKVQHFPAELDVRCAVNLLHGRAIMEHLLYPNLPPSDNWVALDFSRPANDKGYEFSTLKGPKLEELDKLLKLIPLIEKANDPHRHHYLADYLMLAQGEVLTAQLRNGSVVKLEVNLEQKTLNVYTQEMRPIPVNLHFDPNWTPVASQAIKQPVKRNKRSTLRSNYRKGKGL